MTDRERSPCESTRGDGGPRRLRSWLPRRSMLGKLVLLLVVAIVPILGGYQVMIRMPGQSYRGPLLPLTEEESTLRDQLSRDVGALAGDIGGRAAYAAPGGLMAA